MRVKKCLPIDWCLGICLFWMACSCDTDKSQKLLKEITLLQSKPINYCHKLMPDSISQEKLKYIVYSDSINCTSCTIDQMDL